MKVLWSPQIFTELQADSFLWLLLLLPGDEAAVMDNAVFHIHSSVFMCVYRPVVMAPAQSHRGVQVGGGALQWESITPEH